jgi:hypothetical protein
LQATPNVTQWMQADLGITKNIDQIDLYARTDTGAADFPLTFTIAVSTDGSSWETETT